MTDQPDNVEYDVVIIGGGMVGASLACALVNQPQLRIAVVEAYPHEADSQPSFDDRVIALNYGSRRIWEAMGLWNELEPLIEPINNIHVSDRGRLGAARVNSQEERVEALGYVVENRLIGQLLMQRLKSADHIQWYCPAAIETLSQKGDRVELGISQQQSIRTISCRLLVAADGANSRVRELSGLTMRREDYQQAAIITNVETENPHQGTAYERFTDSGPLAFLPMTKQRSAVVWTVNLSDMERVMAMADDEFMAELQDRFGYRLGYIRKVGVRTAYPLAYVEAEQLVKGRVVIIGNAAHTLHPVSGQGYNLALRDVAEIAELIASAEDPGHELLLAEYARKRREDMQRVYHFTDGLVKIFSNNFSPLAHSRAAGLIMVDLWPALRHLLARQSMGLLGRMGKMLRRMPL